MRLAALIHLVRAARELTAGGGFVVVGSSSLLATWPELGEPGGELETSFDADLIPEPFDEEIGTMLHEALGEDRRFHLLHGYHADIIRPAMEHQFPRGWRSRAIALKGCEGVIALEPHDLAAAKCQAGRPKDVALLAGLARHSLIDFDLVAERLRNVDLPESLVVRAHRTLQEARDHAG